MLNRLFILLIGIAFVGCGTNKVKEKKEGQKQTDISEFKFSSMEEYLKVHSVSKIVSLLYSEQYLLIALAVK